MVKQKLAPIVWWKWGKSCALKSDAIEVREGNKRSGYFSRVQKTTSGWQVYVGTHGYPYFYNGPADVRILTCHDLSLTGDSRHRTTSIRERPANPTTAYVVIVTPE